MDRIVPQLSELGGETVVLIGEVEKPLAYAVDGHGLRNGPELRRALAVHHAAAVPSAGGQFDHIGLLDNG